MDEIVYSCNRCGDTFSLADAERHCMDGEVITYCPSCGSTDFEEANRCKVCRCIQPLHKLKHSGTCDDCFKDAVEAYKVCLGYLQPWEKAVLEDEYGEIDITERD